LTREARIEGRVTDAADRPIAGARVVVSESNPMQELARQLRAGKRESVGTQSDPDGRFVLRGLWPGRALRVEASAETFVPARIDGIELPAGTVRSNLTLRLHAGATATGLVTDQQDQPLAAVRVYATRIEENAATSAATALLQVSPTAAATTDAQGRYVLTGLEPGRYLQTFLLPGYSRGFIPATAIVAGTINELPAIKMGSAAQVRGRVVDEQQRPVPGANVFVIDRTLEVTAAVSNANGEFEIGNLNEGDEVSLQVESDGAAPGHASLRVPAAGVTIQLSSARILRGRVYDAITNQPVTDFSVERLIRTPGATTFRLGGSAARSFHDDSGAFELNRVPPGPCVLRVRSPGYQAAEIAVPIVPPPADIAVPMTRGLSLAGRVLLAGSRQPVPNATVAWRPTDAARSEIETIFASLVTGEDTTATDADGQFVLEDLPGGNITLFVSHAEYAPSRTNVTVPARSSINVTVNSGATLAGVVMLDQGAPAMGAVVAVTAAGERMGMMPPDTVTTDSNGRFRFSRLREGSYTLVARAPTGASLPWTVAVAGAEERNDLVLTLKSGATIRGSVRGLRRDAQANIFVMAHGEGYYDSTYTDADGSFTLPHVPAGSIALEATTSFGRGLSAGVRLDIPEDGPGTIEVDIEFGGQAELVGVVSRAGRPASSVLISATPILPEIRTRGRTESDDDGSYRIEGLADGRYQLVFSGASGPYHRTADVQGSTRLDIELPSSSISGMVIDAQSHAPLADVDVTAISGQERMSADVRRATTDSTGRYMLTDLDAGTYQVRATRSGYQQEVRVVNVRQTDERWDFELHRGSGIRLRVVDAVNGAPISRANVRLTTRGVLAFADTLTLDDAGRGALPTLASGDYVLAVMVDGYAPRSLAVQLPVSTIDVSVEPGGRVQLRMPAAMSTRVRLLDAAGIPQVVPGSDPAGWTAVAGPTTVWTNVATGSYRLESMIGGVTSFVVTSGATSVVDVK
jgi:protocatechuate 3,4-dioxygenase beta subunit/5-hydroxyisourate hydrolase-like protein (transthyretin family)